MTGLALIKGIGALIALGAFGLRGNRMRKYGMRGLRKDFEPPQKKEKSNG